MKLPPVWELLIARPLPDELPWPLSSDPVVPRSRTESYLSDEFTRVAKFGDAVVGAYVMVRLDAQRMELQNLTVRDDCRRQGLGRWLLGHALGLAESKGARQVEVHCPNPGPIAYLERGGLKHLGDSAGAISMAFEITPD